MEYIYQKGLKISKLSLGTVQLGLNYGVNNSDGMPDKQTSHEILKAALDGGITVLDTASDYGTSETVIGDFLKANTAYSPTIVTKCLINCNGEKPAVSSEVEAILRKQVENSLKKLNISKIPILMMHRENEIFDYGDIVSNVLRKLKAEGLIQLAGVSLTTHRHIEYISKSGLYEAVQLPLNMMDTEVIKRGAIEKLIKADVLVFVRSVFLQGLFFRKPDSLPQGILQKVAQPLRDIRELAQKSGMSITELAVSFVRDLEGVSSLVLGCETPEQATQNIALLNAPVLPEEIRCKIMSMFDGIDQRIIQPWTWNS